MKSWKLLLLLCSIAMFFCSRGNELAGEKKEECPEAKWHENKILIAASLSKAQFTDNEELNLKITFKNESTKDIYIILYPLQRRSFSYKIYGSETNNIVLQKNYDKMFLGDSADSRKATPIPAGKSFEYKVNLYDLYDLPADKKYRMDIAGNFIYCDTNTSQPFTIKNLNFSIKKQK